MATKQTTPRQLSKGFSHKAAFSYSEEEIKQMIAEAAYYIAEHRSFQGGSPEQDWVQAEAQVNEQLKRLH